MAKILITGGLGYLGSQLADRLLRNPESLSWNGVKEKVNEITLLDRLQGKPGMESLKGLEVIGNADLSNSNQNVKIIAQRKFDAIFHLASYVSQACYDNPSLGGKNIEATKNVLNAAYQIHGSTGKRPIVIFPSSYLVFEKEDENDYEAMADDNTVPNAKGPYGRSKYMSEKLGQQYSDSVDFRVIRLPTVIAPREPTSAATAYAYNLPNRVMAGQDCKVPVPEEYRMPFVWVDDAIDGFIKLHNVGEDKLVRRVMNMSGHSPTTKGWVDTIESYHKNLNNNLPTWKFGKVNWEHDERAWSVLKYALGCIKGDLAQSFGIFPKTGLKAMIEKVYLYVKKSINFDFSYKYN